MQQIFFQHQSQSTLWCTILDSFRTSSLVLWKHSLIRGEPNRQVVHPHCELALTTWSELNVLSHVIRNSIAEFQPEILWQKPFWILEEEFALRFSASMLFKDSAGIIASGQ